MPFPSSTSDLITAPFITPNTTDSDPIAATVLYMSPQEQINNAQRLCPIRGKRGQKRTKEYSERARSFSSVLPGKGVRIRLYVTSFQSLVFAPGRQESREILIDNTTVVITFLHTCLKTKWWPSEILSRNFNKQLKCSWPNKCSAVRCTWIKRMNVTSFSLCKLHAWLQNLVTEQHSGVYRASISLENDV